MRIKTIAVVAAFACVTAASAQQSSDPTAALLQQLIRANSSNPPGVTQGIADVLGPRFRALGFEVTVIPTPDSGKVHFLARLRGDGSKKPVLIAAHADVVGVEREKWTVDPFAGVEQNGSIYGRGAIDFKGGMAVFARAAMMLAENKVPLARDVIFMAEADEEAAPLNTGWLARDHFNLMDCEFALNEGGWIMKRDDGTVRYVSISTADKTSNQLTMTARGTSTHSSMPRSDMAIVHLGRALAKLGDYRTAVQLTPASRSYFAALGRSATDAKMKQAFADLVGNDPAKVRAADLIISQDPMFNSFMRNTISPVIIEGGFRSNVIPGSATATINVRLIPGTDLNAFIRELNGVVGDSLVEIKGSQPRNGTAAPAAGVRLAGEVSNAPSPEDNELFRSLVKEAHATYPGAEVTPYLFQAGTDAGAWRSRGIPVYGIYPYAISDDELSRMHGNDEHVSIAELARGTQMIYRTILNVAKK